MASTLGAAAGTVTATVSAPAVLTLQLKPKKKKKGVKWTEDTVDNEFSGKKKSKICCVFKKKRSFGESSSESEDDHCHDPSCKGHGGHHDGSPEPAAAAPHPE
eukprot:tig00020564_g11434.t1